MDFKPKLCAFDLDGTLAESKTRMTVQMGELLADLLKKMPVAVMSGAAFHQFENQFLVSMPDDANLTNLYLFPTNAAACYVHRNGAWHPEYEHAFGPEEKKRILDALNESLREVKFVQPEKLYGEQIEDRGTQIAWSALGQQAPIEIKKVWDPDRKKRLPIREALLKRLPDVSIGVNAANTIDITRKGITKAYGITRLAELSGITIAEMIYVGDALDEGGNDSVVIETGVRTHAVFGPKETAEFIEKVLATTHPH
ncbi:MAG: HAD-IIB family hydrolase [Patescibacteria group bacterium]